MKWDKVYIEITNICNLKCKFCKPVERKLEYMKLDVFERILKQIQGKTNLVLLHVKGEPMLHPNLKEILELCNKYGIKVNLTTNGTLLKEKIDILKEVESLRQVNISLHSYVENEKVNKNYLNDVLEAVDALKNCYISYRLWNLKDKQENSHNVEILNTPRVEKMIKDFESHQLCEELCKTCGFAQKLSRNF